MFKKRKTDIYIYIYRERERERERRGVRGKRTLNIRRYGVGNLRGFSNELFYILEVRHCGSNAKANSNWQSFPRLISNNRSLWVISERDWLISAHQEQNKCSEDK